LVNIFFYIYWLARFYTSMKSDFIRKLPNENSRAKLAAKVGQQVKLLIVMVPTRTNLLSKYLHPSLTFQQHDVENCYSHIKCKYVQSKVRRSSNKHTVAKCNAQVIITCLMQEADCITSSWSYSEIQFLTSMSVIPLQCRHYSCYQWLQKLSWNVQIHWYYNK